jgi:hypothetical protein
MKSWSDWEIIRRQVAIAGQIVDQRDTPVAGVHVNITVSSLKNTSKTENNASDIKTGWDNLNEDLNHTLSRWDGLYYFMDLPDGQYTVSVHRGGQVTEKIKKVTIARNKKNNLKLMQTDFVLT